MNSFPTKITSMKTIAHNVKRVRVEKPAGYKFIPGQAVYVSINKPELKYQKRPFSFTGLPNWNELEFIIKCYDEHDEITKQISELTAKEELIIGNAWGTIRYKGMGVFIAGGTGITPFISILRDLKQKKMLAGNSLIYSNKIESDIILKDELEDMLPNETTFLLSREKNKNYLHGQIDELVLRMLIIDFARNFYVCGPEPFVNNIVSILRDIGADKDSIILEDISDIKIGAI